MKRGWSRDGPRWAKKARPQMLCGRGSLSKLKPGAGTASGTCWRVWIGLDGNARRPCPRACTREELLCLRRAVQSHQRAPQVALCRTVGRIELSRANEKIAGQRRIVIRELEYPHLPLSRLVSRIEPDCRDELLPRRVHVGRRVAAREPREKDVRLCSVRILVCDRAERGTRRLGAAGSHQIDGGAHLALELGVASHREVRGSGDDDHKDHASADHHGARDLPCTRGNARLRGSRIIY